MDFDLPTAFIFMQVGNHAGETFETIMERKRREFDRAGKIFWVTVGPRFIRSNTSNLL